ncbi:MAG: DUF1553 domain-containing protein [Planctomycetes bacterium]|nr:DUF1553 domain-containing protein [Planctomycetota bacterium]
MNGLTLNSLIPIILTFSVSLGGTALDAAEAVRVEPAQVHLHPSGTQQLLLSQIGEREVDRTTSAQYVSADSKVAVVSEDGLIRALTAGTTNIEVRVGGNIERVQVVVAPDDVEPPIRFATDVVPVLTKLGCNSGGCHGKATGQNGFKLSLLGFEPSFDYLAIVKEARGRRLFLGDADRSLLLMKATATVPHGGGRRLEVASDDYRILRRWIARGAAPLLEDEPVLEQIELSPRQRVVSIESRQQLLVTARFSDGTSRDVTRQAVYQSNEPEIATVEPNGLVETHSKNGLFAVMVRFGGKITTFHAAVPFESDSRRAALVQERLDELKQQIGESQFATSQLDQLMVRQWRRLGIAPSDPTNDETFIRRATVDICGTLPTPEEITAYLADDRADKRAQLIDRLLERPEYASYFALKWADILRNRGAGYSTSKQRSGTTFFAGWIRDSLAANKPYDQFVSEILTASGRQNENAPAIWYRSVRTQTDYVESVAQAFLGVRIQCAQCHHHPFERWSQGDYYGLAAVFARVGRKGGFADAEVPTNEIIYLKDQGDVFHPRSGELVPPKALGGPAFQLTRYDDPRQRFAGWMTSSNNPFFARTMANRMWAHFLGRGIIHPIDDARSTNPPSNPELLDALAAEFIASGYDMKHLIRLICNSYSYRLDSAPTELNQDDTQTFARFYPRRLTAEVLLDGISHVLEVPTQFAKLPAGTRAIELPDENVPVSFLDVFGRPARTSACECERVDAPSLAQALTLINSQEVQRKLTAKDGYAASLVISESPLDQNINDIFRRVLGRLPQGEELETAKAFLESEEDMGEAYRSLLWSLLATNEFMFNH